MAFVPETPGVVASEGFDVCDVHGDPIPLVFRALHYDMAPIVEQHFEKLRTEWATGRGMTRTQAAMADRTQTNMNSFAPLIAAAEAREAEERQAANG
mgnify:CR=1 FL=1